MEENPTDEKRAFAIDVVRRLRDARYEALFAGGCVRDQLLGLTPKDYDIATSATPEDVKRIFGRRKTLAVGAAFGVMIVLGPGKRAGQIEVATFRSDGDYRDGRRPDSVQFSTAEEDAQRRDFTINGMFFDPLGDRLIDYVGGREDLARRMVRAIGRPEDRIAEDKLRMLRAVRFAARFDFALEEATAAAVRHHAAEIGVVSAERIAEEMRRLLSHPNRACGVRLAFEVGLLPKLLPELADFSPMSDAGRRTLLWLEALANQSARFAPALAALLCGCGAWGDNMPDFPAALAVAPKIAARWKLSNEERSELEFLLAKCPAVFTAGEQPWPAVQRILIVPWTPALLDLSEALIQIVTAPRQGIDLCRAKLALPWRKLNPPPLIDGNDLQAMGLQPGPQFAVFLRGVRDEQLLGRLTDKPSALAWVRERS